MTVAEVVPSASAVPGVASAPDWSDDTVTGSNVTDTVWVMVTDSDVAAYVIPSGLVSVASNTTSPLESEVAGSTTWPCSSRMASGCVIVECPLPWPRVTV